MRILLIAGGVMALDSENGCCVMTSDQQVLQIEMLLMEEGYLLEKDLAFLGLKKGISLG